MELTPAELETLCHTPLFRDVDQAAVLRCAGEALAADYEKGQVIYDAAHFRRSLGVLLRGSVQVEKPTDDGRGMLISTLKTGSLFGAAALFHDQPYATDLTARSRCRVIFFPQALLLELLRAQPQAAENYIRYLSGRILFLNAKIAQLSAGSAQRRLARHLLENAAPDPDGTLWAQAGSMTALASRLNIGRASLYRALDALTADGAVVKDGKRLRIPDPDRLRDIP